MAAKIIVRDMQIVGAGMTRADAIKNGRSRGYAVSTCSDRIAHPYRILDCTPALWQGLAEGYEVFWHETEGIADIGVLA